MNKGQYFAVFGAIGLLAGAILPWSSLAHAEAIFGKDLAAEFDAQYEGKDGTTFIRWPHGDAILTAAIGLFLLIGSFLPKGWVGRKYAVTSVVFAIMAVVIALTALSNFNSLIAQVNTPNNPLWISIDIGLYVTMVSAVLAVIGGLLRVRGAAHMAQTSSPAPDESASANRGGQQSAKRHLKQQNLRFIIFAVLSVGILCLWPLIVKSTAGPRTILRGFKEGMSLDDAVKAELAYSGQRPVSNRNNRATWEVSIREQNWILTAVENDDLVDAYLLEPVFDFKEMDPALVISAVHKETGTVNKEMRERYGTRFTHGDKRETGRTINRWTAVPWDVTVEVTNVSALHKLEGRERSVSIPKLRILYEQPK